LPTKTREELRENIEKGIACLDDAASICRKEQYPQHYCRVALNKGALLAKLGDPSACQWFLEAYAFREYLPDQGKQLEPIIEEVCKDKPDE
jgi:hypothetical protein